MSKARLRVYLVVRGENWLGMEVCKGEEGEGTKNKE